MNDDRAPTVGPSNWSRLGESARPWPSEPQDGDNRRPIDISAIELLFRACDPDSPDYDREFHLELFREKPHFFGEDGLQKPR